MEQGPAPSQCAQETTFTVRPEIGVPPPATLVVVANKRGGFRLPAFIFRRHAGIGIAPPATLVVVANDQGAFRLRIVPLLLQYLRY